MGAAAGVMGGGGGAAVNPSSGASSGPQSGTTGSVVLSFGGINLGTEDIPLSASTTSATNQAPTVGSPTLGGSAGLSTLQKYLPYLLIAGALFALWKWGKK